MRPRWPVALLAVSVGLTVLAVFEAGKAGSSNRGVAERTLQDYSAFAAWSYAQRVDEAMRAVAREVVGHVNHGDQLHIGGQVPSAAQLPHALPFHADCNCHIPRYGPVPETYFAFEIRRADLEWAVNTHPMPTEGWEIDRPLGIPVPVGVFTGYSAGDRDAVIGGIRRLVHDVPDREHGFTWIVARLDRGPRMLAYTLMPTTTGDTMVYGAQYTPDAVSELLRGVYERSALLPEALVSGRRNRDIIDVVVRDPSGDVIFASSDRASVPDRSREARLSPRMASLSIAAGIRPEIAGSLVVGGLPRSRVPFLLAILGLAAALSVVAVAQLRREAQLSRARTDWISSVSHELRTPLAQIRLYIDTLRLGRADAPEQREWALSHVDRETTRLHHLVENVLRFSRLGRGTDAAPTPTDVAAEARRIVGEFMPLAASKRVSIDTDIEDVPSVSLRPDSLRHVLLNFLDNAVKYGPEGQRVHVGVHRSAGGVRVAVADRGPGIRAEDRESLWREFTRGATAAETGGSGIGLTIARDVVEQHGGSVSIEDNPGGGAIFVATFPASAG